MIENYNVRNVKLLNDKVTIIPMKLSGPQYLSCYTTCISLALYYILECVT